MRWHALARRWMELAGWLTVAGVCLAATSSAHDATLAAWTPLVEVGVQLGATLRAAAALLPEWSLEVMIAASVAAVSVAVLGGSGRTNAWIVRGSVVGSFVTAWTGAASGRPALAAVAGGVLALAVSAAPNRGARVGDEDPLRAAVPWIVVLAAVIRMWSLGNLPPGFGTHGSTHLALAVDLLDGARDAFGAGEVPASLWVREGMTMAFGDQHGPLAVVHALGFAVLGVGSVEARLTTAMLGTATVWLVSVFGVWLGDRRLGVAAAALLAVAPWHVTFSRGNDAEHVLSPLHAVLALGLVVRAVRRGGWIDWIAAGAAIGLSFYLYAPNQLVPLVGAAYVMATAHSAPGWTGRHAKRLAAAAIVACAVALPFVAVWLRSPVPVPLRSSVDSTPTGDYAVARPDDLVPNLAESARQLLVASDDQWFWSPSGMFAPTTAALWIAGIAACTWWMRDRSNRPKAVLLLGLLVVGMLPGILSAWVFARRLILAAFAVELLAGAGLVRAVTAWRVRRPSRVACILAATTAIVAHVAVGWEISVRSVTVPESLTSTVYPEIARLVSESVPETPVVIAVAPRAPFTDIEDAVRLGAAPAVRPLVAAGHARRNLWRVVEIEDVAAVLDELGPVADHVQVVVPRPGHTTAEETLTSLLLGLGATGPIRLHDMRGTEVAWVWRVPSGSHRIFDPEQNVPDSVDR